MSPAAMTTHITNTGRVRRNNKAAPATINNDQPTVSGGGEGKWMLIVPNTITPIAISTRARSPARARTRLRASTTVHCRRGGHRCRHPGGPCATTAWVLFLEAMPNALCLSSPNRWREGSPLINDPAAPSIQILAIDTEALGDFSPEVVAMGVLCSWLCSWCPACWTTKYRVTGSIKFLQE